jgi:hypothetical protein
MKLKLLIILFATYVTESNSQESSRITVGLGIGGNHLFKEIYDYSLTTDGTYKLKVEESSRNSLVISPVIIFRYKKFNLISDSSKIYDENDNEVGPFNASRFNLLLSVNLLDVKSGDVGFNKKIDGGIGIGYSFSSDIQIGILYEIKNYRQLRNYILENYSNESIPKSMTEFYNALDKTDNNLFYDKVYEGFSVKLIFNVNSL